MAGVKRAREKIRKIDDQVRKAIVKHNRLLRASHKKRRLVAEHAWREIFAKHRVEEHSYDLIGVISKIDAGECTPEEFLVWCPKNVQFVCGNWTSLATIQDALQDGYKPPFYVVCELLTEKVFHAVPSEIHRFRDNDNYIILHHFTVPK